MALPVHLRRPRQQAGRRVFDDATEPALTRLARQPDGEVDEQHFVFRQQCAQSDACAVGQGPNLDQVAWTGLRLRAVQGEQVVVHRRLVGCSSVPAWWQQACPGTRNNVDAQE